ncbi:Hypothetical Protein FCC1311_005732 [Hondaea fermentalgiana]|uniref:Uncharacterized protein n=1 Tax=Hondaea fermentalgiana TaxID=2315210 RepID=A0A2R5G1F3_9STRA|nr:Hypothetical Protein FCC1311_005732 [Hondaea fermentalgiana]|eukprot:GBG24355.1 Hypothetical Protein FCC1311_005732 [Hondaea fermentalgiana]
METYCENNLEAAFEKWSQKSEYVSIEDLECVLADLPKNKRFRTWLPMAATMVQDAIQRGDVDPKKGIKRDAFFALMTHYFKCAKNDMAVSQPPTQSSKSPESTQFDMHLDLDAAQKELDDAAGSPRNAETEEVDSSPVPAASNFRVGIVEVFSSDDDEDDGDEEHDQDDLPSIHSTSSAVHHDVHDPSFQAEDLQENP